jgi:type IV pilus assembly protein PilC
MPKYKYKAQNNIGKTVGGVIEANDLTAFYTELDNRELLCLSYHEEKATTSSVFTLRKTISSKELTFFCRKLGTMFSSGMNILDCIDIIAKTSDSPKVRKLYLGVYEKINTGKPLSDALRTYPNDFPVMVTNMIQSGEESGKLDLILNKLEKYYTQQNKIQAKIKIATVYPKILGGLSVFVVILLFTFVLPQMINSLGTENLPLITKIMMGISNFLTGNWLLLLILTITGFFGIRYAMTFESVQYQYDKMLLNIPMVGKLLKKIYSARLASSLALLYSSGVSVINSLQLSMGIIGNKYIEKHFPNVIEKVSTGDTIAKSIFELDVFDPLLPNMIQVGELTGSLDKVLSSTSNYYDDETETTIQQLLGILEPAMLIFLAFVIGAIVISVIVPIFSSYGIAAQ